jgi:large subunit ribosomal protein L25
LKAIKLSATKRETTGKGPARQLRREGLIPAVLYGPKLKPVLLMVVKKDLEQIAKIGQLSQQLLNLAVKNGKSKTRTAMLKEIQTDPVTGEFLHADFYEVAMDRKIKVNVPVVTTGKSVGVEIGGLLQTIRHEIEVLCLPNEIPESIEIDVSALDIGQSIHVEEIPLPGNVEVTADVNYTVVTVLSPKVEVEEEEEEALEEGEEVAEGEEGEESAEPGEED